MILSHLPVQAGCFWLSDGSPLHGDSGTRLPFILCLCITPEGPFLTVSSCIYLWESIIQLHPITRKDGRNRHAQEEEMDFGEQLAISATLSVFKIRFPPWCVSLWEQCLPIHHSKCCFFKVRLIRICSSSSLSPVRRVQSMAKEAFRILDLPIWFKKPVFQDVLHSSHAMLLTSKKNWVYWFYCWVCVCVQ